MKRSAEVILAEAQTRIERRRSQTRLSTACTVCGRICTGTRLDQYRLVDPDDPAGPRVHAKCIEEERP